MVTKLQSRSWPGPQSPDSVIGAGGAAFIAHRAVGWRPWSPKHVASPPPQHRNAPAPCVLTAWCLASHRGSYPRGSRAESAGHFRTQSQKPHAFLSIMPYRSPRPARSVREATAGGSLEAIRAAGYPSDFRFSFALGSAHLQEGKENDIYICDYKICTVNFSREACDGNWVTGS